MIVLSSSKKNLNSWHRRGAPAALSGPDFRKDCGPRHCHIAVKSVPRIARATLVYKQAQTYANKIIV